MTPVCGDEAPPADEPLTFGVAFTARVTEVSGDVDPSPPDSSPYDWHVELELTHVYRGALPSRMSWNGYHAFWSTFIAERLEPGDRLFVAAERYRPGTPTDPFEGDVIVWQRSGGHWTFARRLLNYGRDHAYYPAAARSADSLADILAVVRAAGLPDTSTATTRPVPASPIAALPLLLASIVGFVVGFRRMRQVEGRPAGG